MALRRSTLSLLGLLILASGVAVMIWQDKRHLSGAEDAFVKRCEREHARPAECEAKAEANHLDCWRLTYTPRGKAQPKASFDDAGHYRCVLDPRAFRASRAAAARKRREQRRRHFIP
jgi:hypothetical protein